MNLPNKRYSRDRANLIWGTKGEKLVAKLQGENLPPEDFRQMRKDERKGACWIYGGIPTHLVSDYVIPASTYFALAQVGYRNPIFVIFYMISGIIGGMAAVKSASRPIKKKDLRKYPDTSSYIIARQMKTYAKAYILSLIVLACPAKLLSIKIEENKTATLSQTIPTKQAKAPLKNPAVVSPQNG